MSDDLFFEGEEPVEIEEKPKKPAVKPKPKGGAVKKKGAPAAAPKKSGAVKKKTAPKPAPVREPGFEFTPMVVMLIAIIALLVGFLGGLLAANTLLTPTINAAPPPGQQMPPGMEQGGGMGGMGEGGMGGMGMGGMGGGMGLDPMSEEELEQLIEEMREQGMPEDIIDQIIAENEAALAGGGAGADADDEDGANDADNDY